MNRRPLEAFFFALSFLVLLAGPASAQEAWPSRPVRIIVPFPAGGVADLLPRLVGHKLSEKWGQPVIVENKAGAGGNIGTEAVAKAAPDGQTIGLSIAGPLGVNAFLFRHLGYDPQKDLVPITIAATQASVLVVSPQLGVDSTGELLALLRKNPGKYNFASMGGGTISRLA
ncbi:MAG TPA: tripartite tricarboxylate transporter substrate-binding protein, partial [Usitatibacter sp.]|nr:tripartite tricarboxylate transporter substrate-binding protein [Usitatibacter sp.]